MNTVIIKTDQNKRYLKSLIDEMPTDGSKTVITKNTDMDSTAKQRRLKWQWNTDISRSGLGQDDNPKDVHIRAKMMFGHPILMRDDEFYADLFTVFRDTYQSRENYPEMLKWFADNHIKTEKFTKSQQCEYLTNLQRYWIDKGVELTDPALQGVDLSKF